MRIVSIDPGSTGYLCFLNTITKTTFFFKTIEDPNFLAHEIMNFDPDATVIEDVHSVYGMSAKSNFRFGYNLGLLYGILQALGISPIYKVQPKIWQQTIGVRAKGKAIKKEVAAICLQQYPNADLYGKRGGLQDGKSDALGIAIHTLIKRKDYENRT